jgi:steroid C-25 hydroxylase gamma subunit
MRAVYSRSTGLNEMLNPHARCWEKPLMVELDMAETPLAMQPTDAIRAQWKNRTHGVVKKVRFTALHNGSIIGFRLDWEDPTRIATSRTTINSWMARLYCCRSLPARPSS